MTPAPSMLSPVQDHPDERRRLGFALAVPGVLPLGFARFADRAGHRGPLTVRLMMDWARGEAGRAGPANRARRLAIVRPFAGRRARVEPGTEVPCADVFGHTRRRPTPHIYTDAGIADLPAAARRLPSAGTLRPLTHETFFGLVAATGLRLPEALRLRRVDFDAGGGGGGGGGVLTIRRTKFRKSRLAPLHPTTAAAPTRYVAARQLSAPLNRETAFPGQPNTWSVPGSRECSQLRKKSR